MWHDLRDGLGDRARRRRDHCSPSGRQDSETICSRQTIPVQVPADRVERTADTSAVALFGISSSMLLQRPLDAAIEFATREGLTAFEVWADHPHAHPDQTPKPIRARLRHALKGFAGISVHGPLGNASLASINPGIWRESVRQHLATVELAHDIEAAVLVVHPGDLRDARFAADFTRLSEEALGRLAWRAEQLGVTIAVENCGPYHAGIDRHA